MPESCSCHKLTVIASMQMCESHLETKAMAEPRPAEIAASRLVRESISACTREKGVADDTKRATRA